VNHIRAIFIKQLVSQIKVPSILVQGVIFLVMAIVFMFLVGEDTECDDCIPAYVCAVCEEEEEARFRPPIPSEVGLFTVIFVGLALVGSTSALVSEDKTTKNLQFMAMADMKPYQYLIGTLPALMVIITPMLILFALFGRHFGFDMIRFMALCLAGGGVSILLGIVIGLSRVPILAMPLSFMLGLGPTFSYHNEVLANILRYTFIQQVNVGIAEMEGSFASNYTIIGLNALVLLVVFLIMHRKNKFNL